MRLLFPLRIALGEELDFSIMKRLMDIQRFDSQHGWWGDYVAHLKRADSARWLLEGDEDRPRADVLFLGAIVAGVVIGNITLRKQVVVAPATKWSGGIARPLRTTDNHIMEETFVQTFFVEQPHRRRGYGRSLQEAALALTRDQGCCQMRSWSSLDKAGVHRLKLSLGFAAHPAAHRSAAGHDVSGAYFVKRVD